MQQVKAQETTRLPKWDFQAEAQCSVLTHSDSNCQEGHPSRAKSNALVAD
jgi:hypothetical protein